MGRMRGFESRRMRFQGSASIMVEVEEGISWDLCLLLERLAKRILTLNCCQGWIRGAKGL